MTDATPKPEPEKTAAELDAWIRPIAKRAYEAACALRSRAAEELGVSMAALDKLRLGVTQWPSGQCWTFPERDDAGLVIGLQYRQWGTGRKWQLAGGRRGLVYGADYLDSPGPVHVVEGATDTAAAIDRNWSAVGRPSCTGGLWYLVPMLRRANRPVVVWGERDRKRHQDLAEAVRRRHNPKCRGCRLCWPGLAGARHVAAELRQATGLRVTVRLPGAKDLRATAIAAVNSRDLGTVAAEKAAGTLDEPIVARLIAKWRASLGPVKKELRSRLVEYTKKGSLEESYGTTRR